jgi:predicted alpha/beta superfamily hydrolase
MQGSENSIASASENGRFIEIESMPAEGLPNQRLSIWLPPEYDLGSWRRFPVLYMHDGHNLFDLEKSNFNKIWAADRAVLSLARQGLIEPHIIVGIWAPGADRYRQYLPRPAFDRADGVIKSAMNDMANGPIVSDRYLDWLADTLKPMIDRQYRTKSDARHTAIAGSSMGGLMSCYAILARPDVYGRAACVSSHWPAADPQKTGLEQERLAAIWISWLAESLDAPKGRRVWMDHGTATLDQFYAPYQQRVDMQFARSGWIKGIDFESRVYQGAEHEENAWAARLPEILAWVLAR